jgi:membrane protein implicated in regulation of membrane protease activity
MNYDPSSWQIYLVIGILLAIFEIFVPGFVLFPVGVAFMLTAAVAFFVSGLVVQLAALSVSLVLVFIVSRKYFRADRNGGGLKTNVDRLIGQSVLVEETIDNNSRVGSVRVEGEVWRARSAHGNTIPMGSRVVIRELDGNQLVVVLHT